MSRFTSPARQLSVSLLPLAALLVLQAWDPGPVEALRAKAFDVYQKLAPVPHDANETLIVDIDDRSLAELGQWPWDRATFGRLLQAIIAAEPKVVGVDIVFAEEDRLSPPRVVQKLSALGAEVTLGAQMADTDDELAAVLANGPVVLAVAAAPVDGKFPLPRGSIATLGADPLPWLPAFQGAIASLPKLAKAAKGNGNISIETGIDGVVRQMPMVVRVGDTLLPALSVEMLRVAASEQTLLLRTRAWGPARLDIGPHHIKLDGRGRIWLHYGFHDPDRFVSALDVLEGRVDTERFRDRPVIIGSSAFGLWDIKATPMGQAMPGVEIQAMMFDRLSQGIALERPNWMPAIEILVTLTAGLILIWLIAYVGARWTILAFAGIVSMVGLGSWTAFKWNGWLIDATFPALSATLICLTLLHGRHLAAESARATVTGAFKKYLSPVLVERLAKNAHRLNLGGENRELTVLFADIQGFTRLSERLQGEPERFTAVVNLLLDRMSEAVLAQGGTIDKFMGDNVMAFWNAPLDQPDHAFLACKAAIAMQRALTQVNAELVADPTWADIFHDQPPLAAGIGINTGLCTVGNFGSRHRFDYSAIGDTVNLASRLEGTAKRYGIAALVSQDTRQRLPDSLLALHLGTAVVRGRQSAVEAFALVDAPAKAEGPSHAEVQVAHEAFMASSNPGALEHAADKCLTLLPQASRLYETLFTDRMQVLNREESR